MLVADGERAGPTAAMRPLVTRLLPLLLLHAPRVAADRAHGSTTIVACEPCAPAASAAQDFVHSPATGALQHPGSNLCVNATCGGDPAATACWPLRLSACSSLSSRASRWFNHTALGGLLTSNGHALDYGTWAPGEPQQVGLGHFSPTMPWQRWKIDGAARRISTVSGSGGTCCLAVSSGNPPPPPPPAGAQPCGGRLVTISAARIRVGVCVGDRHNNATYLSSLSTLSGTPPSWSGSVLMPVGGMSDGSPEQVYDSMLSTTSAEVVDGAGKRTWNAAKGGRVTLINASSVEVTSVQLRSPTSAAIAEETWRITATHTGEIVWELNRTWVADVHVCADRFPALLLMTGIWSMFDSGQVMNMSSGAGFASAPDPTTNAGASTVPSRSHFLS